jgi:hypothetical protein
MKQVIAFGSFFLLLMGCSAPQQVGTALSADNERGADRTTFSNQGQQEEYWARKLFQEQYRARVYPRFGGSIRALPAADRRLFCYDRDTLQLVDVEATFVPLFQQGVLYPLVDSSYYFHQLSHVKELANATNSPQRRRFTVLVWDRFTFNPTVYVFELTNAQATRQTTLSAFVQGAALSFIREGWIMI